MRAPQVFCELLSAVPFFGALVEARRAACAALMELATFGVGDVLFRHGDNVDMRFYVVLDGAIEVRARTRDSHARARLAGERAVAVRSGRRR